MKYFFLNLPENRDWSQEGIVNKEKRQNAYMNFYIDILKFFTQFIKNE